MVSAISFGWLADFGKILTIIQRSSQPVHSDKWGAFQFILTNGVLTICQNKPVGMTVE